MAFLTAAAIGAGVIGGVAKNKAAREAAFKQRQHERDLAYRASSFFDQPQFARAFRETQDMMGSQAILSDIALQGRQQGTALRASINRQLGGTLIGESQAAGVEAGTNLRTNVIRAKLQQEALGLTMQRQSARAQPFLTLAGRGTQGPMQPSNFLSSAIGGQAAHLVNQYFGSSASGGTAQSSVPMGGYGPLNQGESSPGPYLNY